MLIIDFKRTISIDKLVWLIDESSRCVPVQFGGDIDAAAADVAGALCLSSFLLQQPYDARKPLRSIGERSSFSGTIKQEQKQTRNITSAQIVYSKKLKLELL